MVKLKKPASPSNLNNMLEVRFHGIGGQGAVTAADILSIATGYEGKYSQSFPFFGVERRGAPVMSFCRIDNKPIRVRMRIYEPDIVVVLDPSLPDKVDVFDGLKGDKIVVINSKDKIKPIEGAKIHNVDATSIAVKHLGKPIVNTAILGALAKATKVVSVESLKKAIKEVFSGELAEKNIKALEECYGGVK
jgi:pyruvate ferredoxin oxidoreductase gamma subunit/2-oxoisovalerate ferredoxin oxidoreductase gamma subunit